jgi:F-box protein 11
MPPFRVLFQCIGQAVCARGVRALAGAVPFGEALWDIASEALQLLRQRHREGQMLGELQAAAQASLVEVKRDAELVAREVGAALPEPTRQALAAYLTQVPAAIRRSLRRPADPSGSTAPAGLAIERPEDLLPFLPPRLPRYRPGDRPPGIGDWELEELLGVGGFGEVWKARHTHFDGIPPVALKFCLDPDARERLLRHEAVVLNQVMRQGRHPGIVPLLDAFLSLDPPCLKYEYVAGGDLAGLAQEWRQAAPADRLEQAIRVVQRLAEIVGHAHRLQPPVVHRDLKPANVLVQRSANRGLVLRVADFGIGGVAAGRALVAAGQGTLIRGDLLATVLRGSHTPLYASPQQVKGEPPDPRDDVHALGVIWYQLLTGDLSAGAPVGLDWADDLRDAGMDEDLIRLLGSCVSPRAERRPLDAAALAEQIAAVALPVVQPVEVYARKPDRTGRQPDRGGVGHPELTVCSRGTGQYRSIGSAIQAAGPGTRIRVRPGNYAEGFVIDRPVEIVADGPRGSVVVEGLDETTVQMKTAEASVRGLTLHVRVGPHNAQVYCVEVPEGRLLLENCDISSDSFACLAVHGATAAPTVRNCTIHDSRQGGLYIYDFGGGTFEDCEVFGNALVGVEIKQGTNPTLRRCRIHDGKQGGVLIWDGSTALLEDCAVYANTISGVEIKRGANPTLRNCKIHDSLQGGALIWENATGTFENCDIFGNSLAGVEIKQGANPTLHHCRIHDGKQGGVFVWDNGAGQLIDCDIHGNGLANVEVRQGGNPTLRRCRIRDGKTGGLYVYKDGSALVQECDIFGNERANVQVAEGGNPIVRDTRIRDGKQGGIFIWGNGVGTFQDCDLFGNGLAAVEIKEGSNPVFRGCKIHDGKQGGVYVWGGATGTLQDCDIYANARAGIQIAEGGNPVVRRCKVRDGAQGGVFVWDRGLGSLQDCDISGNGLAGVEVKGGSKPFFRACKIRNGQQGGLFIHQEGAGTFQDCEIVDNARAGVEVQEGGHPILRRCRIKANGYEAIWVYAGAGATVTECDLRDNKRGPWDIAAGAEVERSDNIE